LTTPDIFGLTTSCAVNIFWPDWLLTKMTTFNLDHPPFCVQFQQSAAAVAHDFLTAFSALQTLPNKVYRTFDAIVQRIGDTDSTALVAAGRELSRAIDTGIGAGAGNSYHNSQHFCEVMLSAFFLAQLDQLCAADQLELVLAAMAHDFHHDGRGNGVVPFRLERLAVSACEPYLVGAGVPEPQRRALAALILATDMTHGSAIAQTCHASHTGNAARPTTHPDAPELALLASDPRLARRALVLIEADVLPSVGLSIEHAMQLQTRLSQEWGRPLEFKDKYWFVTKAFPGFIIGRFFTPNVLALQQYLLQHLGT
jgi:phosphoheptose isomerase